MIKHLVLGGGGDGGYITYGALKYLSEQQFYNINNIKSIYATSIGSLLSVLITLKYDWKTLDDYIIKRPWDKVISVKPLNILNIWNNNKIFNKEIIKIILNLLLKAKSLSESITLKEFYEYNNVEIHMYSVNINETFPTKIDISYKTHPNLELCKAIYMSASFPIIFSPIIDNSGCYIDGGLLNNFPLNDCIMDAVKCGDRIDEILAFKIVGTTGCKNINENSTFYRYLRNLIYKLCSLVFTDHIQEKIDNIVYCKIDEISNFTNWKKVIVSVELREEIIKTGEKCGEKFLFEKTEIKEPNLEN